MKQRVAVLLPIAIASGSAPGRARLDPAGKPSARGSRATLRGSADRRAHAANRSRARRRHRRLEVAMVVSDRREVRDRNAFSRRVAKLAEQQGALLVEACAVSKSPARPPPHRAPRRSALLPVVAVLTVDLERLVPLLPCAVDLALMLRKRSRGVQRCGMQQRSTSAAPLRRMGSRLGEPSPHDPEPALRDHQPTSAHHHRSPWQTPPPLAGWPPRGP